MTREDAINMLYGIQADNLNLDDPYTKDKYDALTMAIKALEQEPCEDAVNRQTALSKIKEVCFSEEWVQFRVDNGSNGQRDFLINYIEQLPSVTPQPKTDVLDKISEELEARKCCGRAFELGLDMAINIISKYRQEG